MQDTIKKIILGALGLVLYHKWALLKALWLPIVLYMLLALTALYELGKVGNLLVFLASLAIQTIFAITTHRVILLGPDSITNWAVLHWTKRETLFALMLIALGLLAVPFAFLFFIPHIGPFLGILLMCWVTARLSLVFPAIAIDREISFSTSWNMTKNYQPIMFLVVIILPVMLYLPTYLLRSIPYTFVISSLLTAFATVFVVTALSVTYKIIAKI